MRPFTFWCIPVCVAMGIAGCATPLPTYPDSTSDQEALDIIADRLERTRTLVSEADVMLTSSDGQSIRLEAAVAAQFPDRLRLQAWKFSTLVLDLTVLPEATFLYTAEEAGTNQAQALASLDLSPAVRMASGAFFRSASTVPSESTRSTLVAVGPGPRSEAARCEIHRSTLTPVRFEFPGADATVDLSRYTLLGKTPWPCTLGLRSPAGTVIITLRHPELNTDLPPSAFTPPNRARQLP